MPADVVGEIANSPHQMGFRALTLPAGALPDNLGECTRMHPMGFFRSRAMLIAVAGLTAVALFASMAVMFI